MTPLEYYQLLENTVAPEANHLLTEAPNRPNAPGDFGWFCREHVIVTHSVLKVMGHDVDIVRGHISVFFPGRLILSTTKTPDDEHFWCQSSLFPVLDLSMTLKYFPNGPFKVGPVLMEGMNGEFNIIVSTDRQLHEPNHDSPTIVYTPIDYGPEINLERAAATISGAIALHILALVRGESESYQSTSQQIALTKLSRKYPNALEDINGLIHN